MSAVRFRCLVLASLLLAVASAVVEFAFPSLVPEALAKALEQESSADFLVDHPYLMLTVVLPWVAACLASTVGLLFFRLWARALALYSTLLGFAFFPLFGAMVASGLSAALSEASFMLWGAVLALAYYGPVSACFGTGAKSEG